MDTILIIDNDPISTAVCKALLAPKYQVFTMKSGVQALGYLKNASPPELILLDAHLPGLTGLEMLNLIIELENGNQTAVLFMTGSMDSELIQAAYEAGAAEFITKPILPALLQRKVGLLLRIVKLERENRRLRLKCGEAEEIPLD